MWCGSGADLFAVAVVDVERVELRDEGVDVLLGDHLEAHEHADDELELGDLAVAARVEREDVLGVDALQELLAAHELAPAILAQVVHVGEGRREDRDGGDDVEDGDDAAGLGGEGDVAVADGRGGHHAVVEGDAVVEALHADVGTTENPQNEVNAVQPMAAVDVLHGTLAEAGDPASEHDE